jgi:hypothetical protein
MNRKSNDPIEIAVKVTVVTEKAIRVDHGGKEQVWIPKSQITDYSGGPDDGPGFGTTSIFIPEWLALDKGLI